MSWHGFRKEEIIKLLNNITKRLNNFSYNDIPQEGLTPNVPYNLGTVSENTTITFNDSSNEKELNHYYLIFDVGSTVPNIQLPQDITWYKNVSPIFNANKHYEISILNNVGLFIEV